MRPFSAVPMTPHGEPYRSSSTQKTSAQAYRRPNQADCADDPAGVESVCGGGWACRRDQICFQQPDQSRARDPQQICPSGWTASSGAGPVTDKPALATCRSTWNLDSGSSTLRPSGPVSRCRESAGCLPRPRRGPKEVDDLGTVLVRKVGPILYRLAPHGRRHARCPPRTIGGPSNDG